MARKLPGLLLTLPLAPPPPAWRGRRQPRPPPLDLVIRGQPRIFFVNV